MHSNTEQEPLSKQLRHTLLEHNTSMDKQPAQIMK